MGRFEGPAWMRPLKCKSKLACPRFCGGATCFVAVIGARWCSGTAVDAARARIAPPAPPPAGVAGAAKCKAQAHYSSV